PPAAQVERRELLQLDAVAQQARGGRPDDDLVRLGLRLQAGGEVDRLARRERRVGVVGDDLARLDADPGLEPELADAFERREAGADGALGVVLVCERHAECRHDGVPGELLDRAAVRDDALRYLVEEAADAAADDLGIGVGDEAGRVDEIDEENGGELALHGSMVVSAPMLEPAVFKAYDVRGVYPEQLDEEGAYAIGRAYVQQFEPRRIAVGRDMRLSSPQMAEALVAGAADEGAEVLDLGLVGTEMVYFAVGSLALDGGVMVTASHNPKEYTGMKIVRRGALPVGGESGLLEVRDRAAAVTDRL